MDLKKVSLTTAAAVTLTLTSPNQDIGGLVDKVYSSQAYAATTEQKYVRVASLEKGDLTMLLPGVSVTIPYRGGETYVSEDGSVGYVELDIYDMQLRKIPHTDKSFFADLGMKLAAELGMIEKEEIERTFDKAKFYIFISKTEDGKNMITLPSIVQGSVTIGGEKTSFTSGKIGDAIIESYPITKEYLKKERVSTLHAQASGKHGVAIKKDKKGLESEVKLLPDHANSVYKSLLKRMKDLDHQIRGLTKDI